MRIEFTHRHRDGIGKTLCKMELKDGYLTGDTYLPRAAIYRAGGRWDSKRKAYKMPDGWEPQGFFKIGSTAVYQNHGFENRTEYLKDLADNYGMDNETVFALADVFGPNEDFDGLVSELEDLL